jgi:RNA polymerase sigma-70 factor (ECF subfamily)
LNEPRPDERIVELPAPKSDLEAVLDELELVYAFLYARVGNRPDAEDLTQQVALKALPRLRLEAGRAAVRSYLFTTARSVLGAFWSTRLGLPEAELDENFAAQVPSATDNARAMTRVEQILARLPNNYRRVLELRFLRGYSLKDAAREMQTTPGNIKVMQLRALRSAARLGEGDA